MYPEASDYPSDYFRAFFQDDPGGGENGVRVVSERDIQNHMRSAQRISLTHDTNKNYTIWLQARYEGFILCNADGSLHESATFLVKTYLKQQKYALGDEIYFNHKTAGVRAERHIQALFMQMSDTSGLEVTIPSPYDDMVLKTDLILEIVVPGNGKRKIAIQITTNSSQKDNKFHAIRQFHGAHNGIKICENHEVDDVCLLFIRDGYNNFTYICEHLVQVLKSFCRIGHRDETCEREWGEIKIHSIKKQKISHDGKQRNHQIATKPNDVVPVGVSTQDALARLSLPFSPDDFRALRDTISATVTKENGIPGRRNEVEVVSLLDDKTVKSYFPGLISMIYKWRKKGWTLNEQYSEIRALHGRMSPDDYRKLRTLLLQNSLELPKKEQKLQEIAEILERWFPGIYECIDCALCINGTADQKKRLSSYRKIQPENPSPPMQSSPQLREISPEQEARKRERDERRRAQSHAHNQRMANEQIAFRNRIKAAFDLQSEIIGNSDYAKILRSVAQQLKQKFPQREKFTLKHAERAEVQMNTTLGIYKKCLELEKEEDAQQKIAEYLDDFICRFGDGGK